MYLSGWHKNVSFTLVTHSNEKKYLVCTSKKAISVLFVEDIQTGKRAFPTNEDYDASELDDYIRQLISTL